MLLKNIKNKDNMCFWIYFDNNPKEQRYFIDPIHHDYAISKECFFVLDIMNPSIKGVKRDGIRSRLNQIAFLTDALKQSDP